MSAISKRQHARLYIQEEKNTRNVSIYKNPDTLQKSKTVSVTFYIEMQTIYVTQFFIKMLNLAFIYKNHDTLRYVTFLYTKSRYFAKIKTICFTFLYTKIRTFCVTQIFIKILKFAYKT